MKKHEASSLYNNYYWSGCLCAFLRDKNHNKVLDIPVVAREIVRTLRQKRHVLQAIFVWGVTIVIHGPFCIDCIPYSLGKSEQCKTSSNPITSEYVILKVKSNGCQVFCQVWVSTMRGERIRNNNEQQSFLFSFIDMYCVLHFVPLVGIVMAALKTTYP